MSIWARGLNSFDRYVDVNNPQELTTELAEKYFKNIELPPELQIYDKIENLICNYNSENIEFTAAKLKEILQEDKTCIPVVSRCISYFQKFKPTTNYNPMIDILKPSYDIQLNGEFSRFSIVDSIDSNCRKNIRGDNIKYVHQTCPMNALDASKKALLYAALIESAPSCVNYLLLAGTQLEQKMATLAVMGGNMDIINTLEANNVSFNFMLSAAIAAHNYDLVDYLMEKYKVEKIDGLLCLSLCSIRGFYFCFVNNLIDRPFYEVMLKLGYFHFLEFCVRENLVDKMYRNAILDIYLKNKDIDSLRYVFNKLPDNGIIDDNIKLFGGALQSESTEIIKLFIDNGFDPNVKYNFGSALSVVLKSKDFELAELLIKNGADVNIQIKNEYHEFEDTPLTLAIKQNQTNLIQLLLEKGADTSIPDKGGNTPFTLSMKNHDDRISLLIANSEEFVEANMLELMMTQNNIPFVKAMLDKQHGKQLKWETLELALKLNNPEILQFLLEGGYYDKVNNQQLLIPACKRNIIPVVKRLLDNGVDVNAEGKHELSAIVVAARNNYFDLVKLLVEHGADVNCGMKYPNYPLFYACYNNNVDMVKYLIEHSALVSVIMIDDPIFDNINPEIRQIIREHDK